MCGLGCWREREGERGGGGERGREGGLDGEGEGDETQLPH